MPKSNPTQFKKVTYKDDYLLGSLLFNATIALGNVCTYMQNTTPYGEKYQRAFDIYQELRAKLDEFEDALQSCVEARKAKEVK